MVSHRRRKSSRLSAEEIRRQREQEKEHFAEASRRPRDAQAVRPASLRPASEQIPDQKEQS